MSEENSSAVGVLSNHQDAKGAVKERQKSGDDMKKPSVVVGKGYNIEENVVDCYSTGDRTVTWEKYGLFLGSILGLVFGSAFLVIPGLGPVMVDGPLVGWIIGALETAIVTGGLFALGGALAESGLLRTTSLGAKPR